MYTIGLPATMADEEILKQAKFFGQYGHVKRIVININPREDLYGG